MVFTEKTLPTSMAVAMITWGLLSIRGAASLQKLCRDLLNDIITLCISWGLEITVVPEVRPGDLAIIMFELMPIYCF